MGREAALKCLQENWSARNGKPAESQPPGSVLRLLQDCLGRAQWRNGLPQIALDPTSLLDAVAWCHFAVDDVLLYPPDLRSRRFRDAAGQLGLAVCALRSLAAIVAQELGEGPRRTMVALEGIDGCGKATQLELVRGKLRGSGCSVLAASYPRYPQFFGTVVGEILGSQQPVLVDAAGRKSMALWFALDRWEDLAQNPGMLKEDGLLLVNRYTLSNAVFHSALAPDPDQTIDWIECLEHRILGLPRPDLYVILDVPPHVARANMQNRGSREHDDTSVDRYEDSKALQAAARKQYLRIGDSRDDAVILPCSTGSAMISPESVAGEIIAILQSRL